MANSSGAIGMPQPHKFSDALLLSVPAPKCYSWIDTLRSITILSPPRWRCACRWKTTTASPAGLSNTPFGATYGSRRCIALDCDLFLLVFCKELYLEWIAWLASLVHSGERVGQYLFHSQVFLCRLKQYCSGWLVDRNRGGGLCAFPLSVSAVPTDQATAAVEYVSDCSWLFAYFSGAVVGDYHV